jgi:hypothetical protein
VRKLFNEVKLVASTPLGECLKIVTEQRLKLLEQTPPEQRQQCKKTNYLVITDGRPSELRISVNTK